MSDKPGMKYTTHLVPKDRIQEIFYNNRMHSDAAKASCELMRDGLSVEGLEAVIAHSNPFPDKPIEKFMAPQGDKNVVVTVVRNQVAITKPASLTAGKKWGLAIIEHPLIIGGFTVTPPQVMQYSTGNIPTLSTPGTPLTSLFSAFAFDDDATVIDLVGQTVSGALSAPVSVGFDVLKLPGTRVVKMIAQGLEIENTTEELYRGGSVTAAAFDLAQHKVALTRVVGGNNVAEPTNFYSGWPYRYTDVAANPNAVSWDAKDGIYMPNCLRRECDMKFKFADTSSWIVGRTTPNITQSPVQYSPWGPANGVIDTGYSTKVCIFRGLSEQSSLLMNTIAYLETQQDSESALFPISYHEPAEDPVFARFLSEVSDSMPVATVFKGNFLGTWFTSVCEAIKLAAGAVAKADLGVVSTVARGVGKIAKWAGNFNEGMKNTKDVAIAAVPQPFSLKDGRVGVRVGDDVYIKGGNKHYKITKRGAINTRKPRRNRKNNNKKNEKPEAKRGPAKKAGK